MAARQSLLSRQLAFGAQHAECAAEGRKRRRHLVAAMRRRDEAGEPAHDVDALHQESEAEFLRERRWDCRHFAEVDRERVEARGIDRAIPGIEEDVEAAERAMRRPRYPLLRQDLVEAGAQLGGVTAGARAGICRLDDP